MEQLNFTFYDVVQIVLLLAACWACKISGYQKGISDTIGFLEDKGIVEVTENSEIIKAKD
jgi:hypothetical protein